MTVFTGPGGRGRGIALCDAQAAAYAADGFVRASGRSAAVLARGLAESLQVVSALVTIWSDKQPVVALCELDEDAAKLVRQSASPVTRALFQSSGDPSGLAGEIADTIRRRAPVLVTAERIDPLLEALGPRLDEAPNLSDDGPDAEPAAQRIIATTRAWKRPVLLLGRGAGAVVDAAELARLAERLDAPVLLTASCTTLPGRPLELLARAFAERGALIPSGNMVWVKTLARADGVLALGTGLSEVDWFGLRNVRIGPRELVRVDLEEAPTSPQHELVRADARAVVHELARQVPDRRETRRARQARAAGARWRRKISDEARACRRRDQIEPRFAAHAIVEGAPANALFASEGGSCGMWLWAYLWLRPYAFPVQHGTLGVTIPYALGAAVALPDTPIWAVVGDGAFYYHAEELATLAASGRKAVVFVFNDASWSAIRLGQTFLYGSRYLGTDLPATDYREIAACWGCESRVATTPRELERAVDEAHGYEGRVPLVVDVRLPRDHVPYAGANFVLSEFDGVLGHLALPSAKSALGGLWRGQLPLDTLRSLLAVGSS